MQPVPDFAQRDPDLLTRAENVFSQNGEDGIIEAIFSVIGTASQLCCEFGAWDGVHLSNTRRLLLSGWRGVLIEPVPERFAQLKRTYRDLEDVICINGAVDDAENTIGAVLDAASVRDELDFLSVDIDGEDYYALSNMDIRPRLVCVEVNAGHDVDGRVLIPRSVAARNVGQPLQAFVDVASDLGYRLICYTGNAFFLRDDLGFDSQLPTLSSRNAYDQFLSHLDKYSKRWLYMVNKGWVNPWYAFRNPYITHARLGMSPIEVLRTHFLDHPGEAVKQTLRELLWWRNVSPQPLTAAHAAPLHSDSE
jgi:hypothetical protein